MWNPARAYLMTSDRAFSAWTYRGLLSSAPGPRGPGACRARGTARYGLAARQIAISFAQNLIRRASAQFAITKVVRLDHRFVYPLGGTPMATQNQLICARHYAGPRLQTLAPSRRSEIVRAKDNVPVYSGA